MLGTTPASSPSPAHRPPQPHPRKVVSFVFDMRGNGGSERERCLLKVTHSWLGMELRFEPTVSHSLSRALSLTPVASNPGSPRESWGSDLKALREIPVPIQRALGQMQTGVLPGIRATWVGGSVLSPCMEALSSSFKSLLQNAYTTNQNFRNAAFGKTSFQNTRPFRVQLKGVSVGKSHDHCVLLRLWPDAQDQRSKTQRSQGTRLRSHSWGGAELRPGLFLLHRPAWSGWMVEAQTPAWGRGGPCVRWGWGEHPGTQVPSHSTAAHNPG